MTRRIATVLLLLFAAGASASDAHGYGEAGKRFPVVYLLDANCNYATVPGDRTLVGHSYGGLFAAWNAITSPPLFQRYVILRAFAKRLRNVHRVSVAYDVLDGETHNTVFPRALSNGLRFVFGP